MIFADIEAALAERGWATVDLPDPGPIFKTHDWLLAQLREHFGACPASTTHDAWCHG